MAIDTQKLFSLVVPPNTREGREHHDVEQVLRKMTNTERTAVSPLIREQLKEFKCGKSLDPVILEALVYLKDFVSVPDMVSLFGQCEKTEWRLYLSVAIFRINGKENWLDEAIKYFFRIEDKTDAYYTYKLTRAFYLLRETEHPKAFQAIRNYVSHPDVIVSYNAKKIIADHDRSDHKRYS